MNLQLAGSTVLVFGGAGGLGLAIAKAFVEESCQVILADRVSSVVEVASRLKQSANEVIGVEVDVTEKTAVERLAEIYDPEHLIYAVGVGSGQFGFPFWKVSADVWDHVLRVNLVGAAIVACAFAPKRAAAGRGTFLFLSSVAGQIGSQTDPPYSAAKAGLINFAQCAAKDLAPYNVRVNTICPGMIQTELNKSVWQAWTNQQPAEQRLSYEEWAGAKIRQVIPLGRWQTPEDVAAMAVFLASPRAGNITGQTINVDGGFVMHW